MREVFGLFIVVLLCACQKDEIVPVVTADEEVDCGCEYTRFKAGLPNGVRTRVMQPEIYTMDGLAEKFVHYLNTADRDGLEALLVTEQEFTEWIFPEYNIANPKCNISAGMIYRSMMNKSMEGLDYLKSDFFEKDYEFVKLEITNAKQVEEFETYSFFNRTLIHVQGPKGIEIIALAGTIVSLNNRFKLLTYRENNHLPG